MKKINNKKKNFFFSIFFSAYKNVNRILLKKKQKKAPGKYQTFSEEEKDKKCQYVCGQYRNVSE